MRILIVEDEKKLIDILQRSLQSEGYTVDGVTPPPTGSNISKPIITISSFWTCNCRTVPAPACSSACAKSATPCRP